MADPIHPGGAIIDYYRARFDDHGDIAQGAGWPNAPDRITRFDVILDIAGQIAPDVPISLCDVGCGSGELARRIADKGLDHIAYRGIDALAAPLVEARRKFPDLAFLQLDAATASPGQMQAFSCDILVANGVFTVKAGMSHDDMWSLMTGVLCNLWPFVRRGMIFNVMSKMVDWERDDLFHVSYDALAQFLHGLAGRRIGFRADYGLYEYMAYATKPIDGDI